MPTDVCEQFKAEISKTTELTSCLSAINDCRILPTSTRGKSYIRVVMTLKKHDNASINSIVHRALAILRHTDLPPTVVSAEFVFYLSSDTTDIAYVRVFILTNDFTNIDRIEDILAGPYVTKVGMLAIFSAPHPQISCCWRDDPTKEQAAK